MLKQKSFMRLSSGSLGETTFVKSQEGYRAQEKRSLPPGKFKTDPAFQRVRENNSEFQSAAETAKLLRYSINPLVKTAHDGRTISRLVRAMMKVVKSDTVSAPGKRNFLDGDMTALKDFEFNANSLSVLAFANLVPFTINRVTGALTIDIPSFIPSAVIDAPAGATHFEIVTAGDSKTTGILPLNPTALVVNAAHTVAANSTLPLMLVFGIKFHEQTTDGHIRPFLKGIQDALKIVVVQKS